MRFKRAFKQEGNDGIKDGMDIAICTIDKTNNTLEFSGANRPLYYIKNRTLEIIKGNKKCIGGIDMAANEVFANHIIPIDSIDSFYLFTDGLLDQFGGILGKKFLCKRFKELLSSTHIYTMNEQKEILLNALMEWKGDTEQTDDICVFVTNVGLIALFF